MLFELGWRESVGGGTLGAGGAPLGGGPEACISKGGGGGRGGDGGREGAREAGCERVPMEKMAEERASEVLVVKNCNPSPVWPSSLTSKSTWRC